MLANEQAYSLNKKKAKNILKQKELFIKKQQFTSKEEKEDFEAAMAILQELVNLSDYNDSSNFVLKA